MQRLPLKQGEKIQLNNRQYTVDKELGRGATCIVYKASYTDAKGFSHNVNVKECYPHKAAITREGQQLLWANESERENGTAAFCTTYEKLMQCQNGNYAVHAFDICKCNNTLYIVMDANHGVTFDKDSADNIVDVLNTVKLLTHIVGEYHKNGYLHLDIKPSNFLVYPRPSEHIILFDMDTVTRMDDIHAGNVNGFSYSDSWAAPEQKQGKLVKLCSATDLFAIGAILFEKIMGRQVTASDMGVFAEWKFDGEWFENINPKIKRLLSDIFKSTLSANIKRRYQTAGELLKDLSKAIDIARSETYLKSDDVCCSGYFVGRESELSLIKQAFDSKKKAVFLRGFGGIGKTEIARKYAELHKNEYDTTLFLKYDSHTTLSDLLDDVYIENFNGNITEHRRALRRLFDDRTLVIVDNFDVEIGADNGLKMLFETKAHVLVSTRTDFISVYNGDGYQHIEIKELADTELMQVFFSNAKITVSREDERIILHKIFKLVQNHTYATELLAKQMQYSGWTLSVLYQKLKEGFASLNGAVRIVTNKDEDTQKDTSLNLLRAIYGITNLTDAQKQIMMNLYMLRFMNITKDGYVKYAFSTSNSLDDINILVEIGLIQYNRVYYMLHPLMEELISFELKPDLENCKGVSTALNARLYNTRNYDGYSEADESEFKADCEFLCAFFRKTDLSNPINRKVLIGWLLDLIENENVTIGHHDDFHFRKIYQNLERLTIGQQLSDLEKSDIYYILLSVWLEECYRIYFESIREDREKLREESLSKYYHLSMDTCLKLPVSFQQQHIERIADVVILMIDSFMRCETVPKDIVVDLYKRCPSHFKDTPATIKQHFGLPLTEEEQNELNEPAKSSISSPEADEEISCKRGFFQSCDKCKYIQDIISNNNYSPMKRAELVWYCTSDIFDDLFYHRKNRSDWDWAVLDKIFDLEEDYLISDDFECIEHEAIQDWNNYIQTNTINRIIVFAALDNYEDFREYFDMLMNDIGHKLSRGLKYSFWARFLKLTDWYVYPLWRLYESLIELKKAHLVLPYITQYLEGWKKYAEENHYTDERDFFSLYKAVAECAECASTETVDNEQYLRDFRKIEWTYRDKLDDIIGVDYSLKIDDE